VRIYYVKMSFHDVGRMKKSIWHNTDKKAHASRGIRVMTVQVGVGIKRLGHWL